MALSPSQAGAAGAATSLGSTAAGFGIGSLFGGPLVGGMIGGAIGSLGSALFNLGAEAPGLPGPTGGQRAAAAGLQTSLGEALRQRGLTAGQVSRQYQASGLQQETLTQQVSTLDNIAMTPFEREGLARVLIGESRRVAQSTRRDIAQLDVEADERRVDRISKISRALAGVSSDIQRIQTNQEIARQRFEAQKWQNFEQMVGASAESIAGAVAYAGRDDTNAAATGASDTASSTIPELPDMSQLETDLQSRIRSLNKDLMQQYPFSTRLSLFTQGG